MSTYSIREVLEMAVQTEKVGGQFYAEMAARFKDNEAVSELFQKLAARERDHEKTFQGFIDSLGQEEPEGWEEASKYMRAIVESAFFLGRNKATDHMQTLTDYRQAVGLALAFEKETLLYFYGVRPLVSDPKMVDAIIEEEKNHIMWLSLFRK